MGRRHIFAEANYHKLPGWCKHCNGNIFAETQGFRCAVCNIDCHKECLDQLTQLCITAGELPVQQSPTDFSLIEKAKTRRTSKKIRQTIFNRQAQIKINNDIHLKSVTKTREIILEIDTEIKERQRQEVQLRQLQLEKEREEAAATAAAPSISSSLMSVASDQLTPEERQAPEPHKFQRPMPTDPTKVKINLTGGPRFSEGSEGTGSSSIGSLSGKSGLRTSSEGSAPSPAAQLQRLLLETPQTMKDYEIVEESFLGKGQFSTVRSGFHLSTGADVAVKIIDKARFTQKPQSQRFLKREVEILMSVSHPNIIKLYTIEDTPTHLFMFMEL